MSVIINYYKLKRNVIMIIQTKKREGEKNGRLSIINRKSVKMDFPENKNRSDNDIFKTTERILSIKPDKGNQEKRIDQYFKVFLNNILGQISLCKW